MQWNKAQKRAIEIGDGPALILAGPGSGKTAVIVNRVRFLIENRGVRPENILLLTFTRAAAQQMKARAAKLAAGADKVTYGTFHSVFFNLLNKEWGITKEKVISEEQKEMLFRRIIAMIRPSESGKNPDSIYRAVSAARRTGGRKIPGCEPFSAKEILFMTEVYVGWLRKYDMVDYDEMIERAKELFLNDGERRLYWRQRYRYILIDEFQDVDESQYDLIRLLAYPENNLFVVGDDDQSIYGFRGAGTGMLRRFAKDYPKARSEEVTVNYRSTPQIIGAAQRLIEHNKDRLAKRISAENKDGEKVHIGIYKDAASEAAAIALRIKQLEIEGFQLSEIAILIRISAQKKGLEAALKKANIPVFDHEADAKKIADEEGGASYSLKGNRPDEPHNSVRLITMHAAKGLEFDAVFIPNVCEGLMPYNKAGSRQETEEERRLFYVAMTRARHRLYISCPEKMWGRQMRRSRFINEMTENTTS